MELADVAFYQYKYKDPTLKEITGWIDFERMRTMSPAVIIRAGQNLWKDIAFDISWKNAKAAGLARGSYFFYDSRVTPKVQAEKWTSVLGADRGELPLFCDFEDRYGGAYGSWKHWYDFVETLKVSMPDKEICIYTGPYYWIEKTISVGIPIQSLNYFKQYKLWIAHYGVSQPLVPKPWDTWTFWQHTDNGIGADYGVQSGNIDLNYFNGDEAAFRERFRLGNIRLSDREIPLEITGENKMYQMTTMYNGTRIRKDHNTFAEVITSVNANIIVSGDEFWYAPADGNEVMAGDKWLHVIYGGFTGWMAYIHKGLPVCKDYKIINEYVPDPMPTPEYQDVAVSVNIYNNEIVVLVNGEEWVKKV